MKSSSRALLLCLLVGSFATFNCQDNPVATSTPAVIPVGTTKANTTVPEIPAITTPTYKSDNSTTNVPPITDDTTTTKPTTPSPVTTTIAPPEPTTAAANTTTAAPNSTTTVVPDTTPSTTVDPNSTTTTPAPPTTIAPNTTTTTTTPAPEPIPPCHSFSGPSFIGGIVLTLGLLAIGLVAYKFYKARNERNYHTL